MAEKYGYMAKIGVDSSGVQSGLKTINGEITVLDSSLKKISSSIKAAESAGLDTAKLLADKQGFLNEKILATEEKYRQLASVQENVENAWKHGKINDSEYVEFTTELNRTNIALEKMAAELTATEQAARKQDSVLTDLSNQMHEFDTVLTPVENELKEVNSVIKETGGSSTLFSQQLGLIKNASDGLRLKLKTLEDATLKMNAALKYGDITDEQYRQWQRDIEKTRGELNALTNAQEHLTDEMNNTGKAALTLGDIIKGNVIADAVTSGVRFLADLLKEGARAAAEFTMESIETASGLTEVKNVVDTTFGDKSSVIYDFADTAAEKFGLAELSAQQYAGTMGAMLKSSGITSGIEDMSAALAGLSGDMASFYNISSDNAFEKLRSGISGETEPLKQLGINMNVANLEAYALSQGIEKSWKSMSQAEQTMLRYNYIMAQTADVHGDFEKTSGTFANQQRILELNLNNVKAALGEKLLPVAERFLTQVNDNMPKLEAAADLIGDRFAGAFDDLSEGDLPFLTDEALPAFIDTLEWVVDNGDTLLSVAGGFVGVWGASKAGKFAVELDDIIEKADKLPGVVEKAGNYFEGAAGKVTAAAGAITAAAIAAKEAAGLIDAAAEKLGEHSETVNDLEKESDALRESADSFRKLAGSDPMAAWKTASDNIGSTLEQQRINALRIEELNEIIANNGIKNFYDNSGNLVNTEYYDISELQDQIGSLTRYNAEAKALEAEYQKILDSYTKDTIIRMTAANEQVRAANAQQGRTQTEATASVWENIRTRTKEKMDELDNELAIHNLTEAEYYAQRRAYLEAHRDEENADWWGYYDKVTEYYEKLSDTEREAAQKAADEAQKEQEKRSKDAESQRQKELDAWEDYAEKTADAVKDRFEKVNEAFEKSKQEYINALDLTKEIEEAEEKNRQAELGLAVSIDPDKKENKSGFAFADINAQTEALRKSRLDMEKLSKTGISEEYLNNIKAMDYQKRSEYVSELLAMNETKRNEHYADINAYYAEAAFTAGYDTSDMYEQAAQAAESAEKAIMEKLPSAAYQTGIDTANELIRGFNRVMGGTSALLGGSLFNNSSKGVLSSAGNALSGNTVINIPVNLDGKQIAKGLSITVDELLRQVKNSGGMIDV